MASGEGLSSSPGLVKREARFSGKSTPDNRSPVSSRDGSPAPERLSAVQQELDPTRRAASPRLSPKALEELKSVDQKRQEKGWDPDDPPLSTPWTFWFQRTSTQPQYSYGVPADPRDFSEGLRSLYTVQSINEFFSVFNNIKPADQLYSRECYHLMRNENRRPMWEDHDNIHGGQWTFKCPKEETVKVWLELLLAAIGEQFADCTAEDDDVVGVSVKSREYESQFQIWNENASSVRSATVMERVRELLPGIEIRDFYTSTKERLSESSSRTYHSYPAHQYFSHSRPYRPPPPRHGGPVPPPGVSPYHYYPSPRPIFQTPSIRPPHSSPSHGQTS